MKTPDKRNIRPKSLKAQAMVEYVMILSVCVFSVIAANGLFVVFDGKTFMETLDAYIKGFYYILQQPWP